MEPGVSFLTLLVWKTKDSPWKDTERVRVVRRGLLAEEISVVTQLLDLLGLDLVGSRRGAAARVRSTDWERLAVDGWSTMDAVGDGREV